MLQLRRAFGIVANYIKIYNKILNISIRRMIITSAEVWVQ